MRKPFRAKSILELLIEVGLVGVGVFLGLLANQWHEDRQHRELADATLRYFREEIIVNKRAIERVRPYHTALSRDVEKFLKAEGPKTTEHFYSDVHFFGVKPVEFERTAWDLALATQSFSYLSPKLAYAISRVYTRQQAFQTLQNGFLQAVLGPTTYGTADVTGLATSINMYLLDVNIHEPQLITLYDQVLPQIEAAFPK
jgi:hypothetical protein